MKLSVINFVLVMYEFVKSEIAYVQVDCIENRHGPSDKANADARGEYFAEAVKAEDVAGFTRARLEGEIRRDARGDSVV